MAAYAYHAMAWSLAFWIALALYRVHGGQQCRRFIMSITVGGYLCHAGWVISNLDGLSGRLLWSLVDLRFGYSSVFLPLGVVSICASAAAVAPLPLAIAAAKVGCLLSPGEGGSLMLFEITALGMIHLAISRVAERWTIALVLIGFGGVRLAVAFAVGDVDTLASYVAMTWVAIGALTALVVFLGHQQRSPED